MRAEMHPSIAVHLKQLNLMPPSDRIEFLFHQCMAMQMQMQQIIAALQSLGHDVSLIKASLARAAEAAEGAPDAPA